MHLAVQHALGRLQVTGFTDEQIAAGITAGDWTFLFDDAGNFIE
jgi:hypothetical protein